MKKIVLIYTLTLVFFSCNINDDTTTPTVIFGCTDDSSVNYNSNATNDDDSCVYPKLTFIFSQNWDGTKVDASDFGGLNYTNANGELLSILKLRYLISKIILHQSNGETIEFEGYQLVDLSDESTLTFTSDLDVPKGDYSGISFIYGFNEADNIDGAYQDLNSATWNWPAMLGGGYHFMQFEGNYLDGTGAPQPFAYHNGTARVSDGVFEQNFIEVVLPAITISNNATVEIKMNIAEWFKNPNTWDLNVLNGALMGNYDAQIMMNENGQNVFSLGEITQ